MKKGWGCLMIFLVLALLVSVGLNFLQIAAWFGFDESALGIVHTPPRFSETLEVSGGKESKDKIVRIDLQGIISSGPMGELFSSGGFDLESVKRALQQAAEDKNVKAIVLRIDSPGGEVTAADTLYHAVKKADERKPVVIYMDSLAASGGYYVACGAKKIIANETTLTGSIGVIIQSLNYKGTMDKLGLESMTFVSGSFKDSLSGARAMRDDEKAYVQGLVTSMYEKFLGIVSEARKIDQATLKNGIADGRVFTGKEALEKKLVDQTGYIEDAYTAARQLGHAPDAVVVRYQAKSSLKSLLGILGSSTQNNGKITVELSGGILPRLEPGKVYLLPAHMAP